MSVQDGKVGAPNDPPLVVWRVIDGKPGHENQSRGLLRALGEIRPVQECVIDTRKLKLFSALGAGRWGAQRDLPRPDLLIGAGHRTHYWLLAGRFWRGGRSVVLMKPTFPGAWFDLCVVSKHDGWSGRPNVLEIRGVLNAVQRTAAHDPARGLILIGGPSRHATWSNETMARQTLKIISDLPAVQWTLTTSRRTPAEFLHLLETAAKNLEVVPVERTGPDWVARNLAESAQVWVSPDSVSMVYEALTSGAAVGLLDLKLHARSKLNAGLRGLVDDGRVTSFARYRAGDTLSAASEQLDEAGRCARWIVSNWFAR